MIDERDQEHARNLIAVLTVGCNFDLDVDEVKGLVENIVDGSTENAVDMLIGVTAFIAGMAEAMGVDIQESIKAMALEFALDPEGSLKGVQPQGE